MQSGHRSARKTAARVGKVGSTRALPAAKGAVLLSTRETGLRSRPRSKRSPILLRYRTPVHRTLRAGTDRRRVSDRGFATDRCASPYRARTLWRQLSPATLRMRASASLLDKFKIVDPHLTPDQRATGLASNSEHQ